MQKPIAVRAGMTGKELLSPSWASKFLSFLFLFLFSISSQANGAETSLKTKNVFLIVTDGFRWQEVFTGAEEQLLNKTNGGVRNVRVARSQFWRETPEARREALLPFLWSEVVKNGQIFGNQLKGSV